MSGVRTVGASLPCASQSQLLILMLPCWNSTACADLHCMLAHAFQPLLQYPLIHELLSLPMDLGNMLMLLMPHGQCACSSKGLLNLRDPVRQLPFCSP